MKESFTKKHPKLSLLFINLFVVIIIFVLFEFGLRVFCPNWLAVRMELLNAGTMKEGDFGGDRNWKTLRDRQGHFLSYLPNSSFNIYHQEYHNKVFIDEFGGRKVNNNLIYTKDSNKIIFIGDSFTFGVGVEGEETFVSLFQKDCTARILNFGVAGSSLPNEINILERRLNKLKINNNIDFIVFCWFLGNDFEDILIYDTPKPIETNKKNTSDKNIKNESFYESINRLVSQNEYLRKIYIIQYFRQKLLNIVNKNDLKYINPIFNIMNSSNKDYKTKAYEKSFFYINKVDSLSKVYQFKPIFLLIPDVNQVNDNFRVAMAEYYNIDNTSLNINQPNAILHEILNTSNIDFVDPLFCMKDNQKLQLYYTQDTHFTKTGHLIFNKCIKENLRKYLNQ